MLKSISTFTLLYHCWEDCRGEILSCDVELGKQFLFFWPNGKTQLKFSENYGGKLPLSQIWTHLYEERSIKLSLPCLSEGEEKSQHNEQRDVLLVFTPSEGYQNDSYWAAALKAVLYSQPSWSKIKASQIGVLYTHRLNILYTCTDFL